MEEAAQPHAQSDDDMTPPGPNQTAGNDPAGAEAAYPAQAPGGGPAMSPVAVYAQAILDEQIAWLTRQGYVIVNRTETSAQLRRRKHFSVWWALFWLIVGAGVGLFVYIAWYVLVKRDRVAFLRITPEGRVMLTEN